MKSSFKQAFVNFANELELESNATTDLWTWLPSYAAAKVAHGDQALMLRPSTLDVLKEAAALLSALKVPLVYEGAESDLFKASDDADLELFKCSCGECKATHV